MDKVTTLSLQKFKDKGRKITALTAYDAVFARLMDRAGVDVVLVGDSVGMTMLGRPDTLSVTLGGVLLPAVFGTILLMLGVMATGLIVMRLRA